METIGRFSEPEQNNPELEARSSMKAGKWGQSVVTPKAPCTHIVDT